MGVFRPAIPTIKQRAFRSLDLKAFLCTHGSSGKGIKRKSWGELNNFGSSGKVGGK
ncbi:hypothetical protein SRABI27_03689 [Pedobacter sp. Bi27]|nr:hypothetical protein SRABI27_03689 [Pedobacter sp. Bi27]